MNGERLNKLEKSLRSLKRLVYKTACGKVPSYTLQEIYDMDKPSCPMEVYVTDFDEIWFWNGTYWSILTESNNAPNYKETTLTATATTFALYWIDSHQNQINNAGSKDNPSGYYERYANGVLLDRGLTDATSSYWYQENFNWATGAADRRLRVYFPEALKRPKYGVNYGTLGTSWSKNTQSGVYYMYEGDVNLYYSSTVATNPFQGSIDLNFQKKFIYNKGLTMYGTQETATGIDYKKWGVNYFNTRDEILPERLSQFNKNMRYYYGELWVQGRQDAFWDSFDWEQFRLHVAPFTSIIEYSMQNARPANFADFDWFQYPEYYKHLDLLYAYYLTGTSGSIPTAVQELTNLSLINFEQTGISGEIPNLGPLSRMRWVHLQTNGLTSVANPFTISDACYNFRVDSNAITNPADINRILVAFDNAGRVITTPSSTFGIIRLQGGTNAAPDASSGGLDGLTAINNLTAKGWSITHN